ncbi:Protein kinase-like [Klebsormidium nitens]|uniref:Protein kinase-like n=1 Tax=Klebsormidium nitens TaxID=105231 RepID=A0A1Y1IEM6_KLENI|nr:Protein kinase-like [Klebsormidium nitens]|eukprot:GAQ89360.1 Protein kinase-like [Klebsormidium nitens]
MSSSSRRASSAAFLLLGLFVIASTFRHVAADYVVTGPGPGPAIAPSTCPFTFLDANVKYAAGFCSSSFLSSNSSIYGSTCCNAVRALLFQSRVRYANETGTLLLPQSSADACIQAAKNVLPANNTALFSSCGIDSSFLSEDTGEACGPNLVTVYDFWSAANHTYPGIVGASCYKVSDCSACLQSVSSLILSLGPNRTLLSTPECQDLAEVAMTASAYPVVVANGISGCLHQVEIQTLDTAPVCDAFEWDAINFTSARRSCGPEQYRNDRCCDLVLGMAGQVHALYMNKSGTGVPQNEADVCLQKVKDLLVANGIASTVLDNCKLVAFQYLFSVGCYNYTTINQPIPESYMETLEGACNPDGDCTQCQPTYLSVGKTLANTTVKTVENLCEILMSNQYLAHFDNLGDITDRLNCFFQFPPPLQLAFYTKSKGITVGAIVGIALGAVFLLVVVAGVLFVIWRKRRTLHEGPDSSMGHASFSQSLSMAQSLGMAQLVLFSYSELRRATKGFEENRVLGKGGSGKVYLGSLKGKTVAIKEITRGATKKGAQEFRNEVMSMAQCRHRHLVSLEGCCASERHCILVYEYMEQGSLDDHLYEPREGATPLESRSAARFLDWPARLKIALGTARGLAYLHEDCKPRIIHRDVKPSNILLDADFEAKVSDFGLAKLTADDDTHVTASIVGTWGYLAPEYAASGQLTDKSDVYSFGVVLLTLVAGRRPTEPHAGDDKVYLTEWAWILAERGLLPDLIDPRLHADLEKHGKAIDTMTRVALLCIHTQVSLRPTMRQCISMLTDQIPVPALPSRPMTIFTVASMASSDSGSSYLNTPDNSSSVSQTSTSRLLAQRHLFNGSFLSRTGSIKENDVEASGLNGHGVELPKMGP